MIAAEFAFTCLSAIWCALAWAYADPPDGGGSGRRIAASLAFIIPLAGLSFSTWITAAVVLAVTLAWYLRLTPRNDHAWETEYGRAPGIAWDGNQVQLRDIRNFRYRTKTDPIPAWYDDIFDIETLTGVDLVCSYWTGPAIAHVFLTFGFADGRHLAVSVETRRRKGQTYSAIAGFFRHYQLIFVAADECDLIGVRTDIRRERVYLYPLRITPDETKRLFRGYMNRAATLAGRPEFYNTLTDNCTSNIVRIIDRGLPRGQRLGASWRLLFSGYADAFAYDAGRLAGDGPFAELKQRSLIVRPANAVIGEDFSAEIRESA